MKHPFMRDINGNPFPDPPGGIAGRWVWEANETNEGSEQATSMTNERKNITQPADWWAAFEAEANRRGLPLSEFMGLAAAKLLAKDQRAGLSKRVKPGRKKDKNT